MIGSGPPDRDGKSMILPAEPSDAERASYAWRALPYLTLSIAISSFCIMLAQVLLEVKLMQLFWYVVPILAVYTGTFVIYQLLSLPVNFTGRSFELTGHDEQVASWHPEAFPSVDFFLPICGEPLSVLLNTWLGVAEAIEAYPGDAEAFVLDDGDSDEARDQAARLDLNYIRRPDHTFKKSGNLNYAFKQTHGDMIVIFDADFRPRRAFLRETLPYMDESTVGIVQTPQFFRAHRHQSWVERAAGPTLEIFYRVVQVSRNRFGSALCVGSNAVYRRAALEPSGGFTQIPYAEDSHTGLAARHHGYSLVYVPVPLAAGVCPSTLDLFMRQQYRWCCGATSLVWTAHMWRVKMPWRSRLPYVSGWLWNLYTAMRTIFTPVIPVVLLVFVPGDIELRNSLLLIPAVATGLMLYPLWHTSGYSWRAWPLMIAVGWAQVLALWDFARGNVMSWQPSRGPADASRRFWWGLTLWNGTLAVVWVGVALYRFQQSGSDRFAVVLLFGVVNALIIARLVFSGWSKPPPTTTGPAGYLLRKLPFWMRADPNAQGAPLASPTGSG